MALTPDARIPFRPLSYKNVDLAFKKELIVDYDNANIYLKNEKGEIISVTDQIVQNTIEQIFNNPDINIAHMIKIVYGGKEYYLDDFITDNRDDIVILKELLGWLETVDGSSTRISLTVINEIKEAIKVIQEDITAFKTSVANSLSKLEQNKSESYFCTATVSTSWTTKTSTGGKTYYAQNIAIPGLLSSDVPVITLVQADDYDTSLLMAKEFNKLYRAVTIDGYLTVYAKLKTNRALTIQLTLNRKLRTIPTT